MAPVLAAPPARATCLTIRVWIAGAWHEVVEAEHAPIGRGSLLLHRHPTVYHLWCLTHRDTGVVLGTATRKRTLADAARLAWRGTTRRQRDLVRGRARARNRANVKY